MLKYDSTHGRFDGEVRSTFALLRSCPCKTLRTLLAFPYDVRRCLARLARWS